MTFGKQQIEFMEKKNYLNGLTLEERIQEIVAVVRRYEPQYSVGLADRIEDLIKRQILSPSTPQWANLGKKSSGTHALPISCYITAPQNSIQGIYYGIGEVAMMSKLGGGVGTDMSNLYDGGTYLEEDKFHTNEKLDWVEDSLRASQKVSQGSQRRGYSVPFFSIDDGEFDKVIERCSKKNPNEEDPFVNNNIGWFLPTGWEERIRNGDKELKRRYLLILKERASTGKFYLIHEENCNKNQSPVYSILGHNVCSTNICTEALTPKYDDKSFTCVLSSLNLVHWDEIKSNPQIIKDAIMFLDINVSEFIRLTEGVQFMEKARRSAIEKRDVGLGTLGFHDYLQSKGAAFGSILARFLNNEIYSTIQKYSEECSRELGEKLGSPKLCQDAGLVRRHVSLNMVAPNKSTSFICGGFYLGLERNGTSLGIEPYFSNYFVKSLAGIQVTFKNPHLKKLLQEKGKDTPEVWASILKQLGSVQHLDFLTKEEKSVFKTFSEISPKDIIDLASDRQKYIDMSQSLNIYNRPNYTLKDYIAIHKYAWDNDIKTVYYMFSDHAAIEKEGAAWDVCESCAD